MTNRVLPALEAELDASVGGIEVVTLVMGPDLASSAPGAVLRRVLVDRIRAFGASVEPEHKGLIAAAERHLGAGHALDHYETYLVKLSHLVVIIPDSVGSFCELGLFAASKFSPKLLILANDDHPDSGSYIADGPLTSAKNNSAELHFVDYSDHDATWAVVKARLERIRAQMISSRMLGGEP